VGQIFFLRGKEQETTDAVGAGDICAIPKLTGDDDERDPATRTP